MLKQPCPYMNVGKSEASASDPNHPYVLSGFELVSSSCQTVRDSGSGWFLFLYPQTKTIKVSQYPLPGSFSP